MRKDRGIFEPEGMRVLIVSPSYLPEIGAAPSRITNMAEGLSGLGIKVDVLNLALILLVNCDRRLTDGLSS